MLQVWGGRAQEVGVSKDKEEKKRKGSGPATKSVGESKRTLWCKRTVSKRSSDEHGGVDNEIGGSYSCRV